MVTHYNLGRVLNKSGRPTEAEKAFRQTIAMAETFDHDFLNQFDVSFLVKLYFNFASSLTAQGKPDEAEEAFRKLLELKPKSPAVHNNLAWEFATCADPKLRNGKRAIELAKKAIELDPKQGNWWITLCAAHYCAGNWKDALAALEQSMKLRKGGDEYDWFFMAMVHWKLGDKTQARSWYDKAVPLMEKNRPDVQDLIRVRAEAAALLGVKLKKD